VNYRLHFLGVGAAHAHELGCSSAVFERDELPLLLIDAGPDVPAAYEARYGDAPRALFITHAHMDHVGGLERLFFRSYFDATLRGKIRLYVPAPLVPILQSRVADYPDVLAEGGANFWDSFQLVPVSRGFWHAGLWFAVFPTRHHAPNTSFGVSLRGSFVYTGDTRPIPEMLSEYAKENELVAHDCGVHGNPSHTGVDDLDREYPAELRARLRLYHYGSAADGAELKSRGYRVIERGENAVLSAPTAPQLAVIADTSASAIV